jgi:hypothetical protein
LCFSPSYTCMCLGWRLGSKKAGRARRPLHPVPKFRPSSRVSNQASLWYFRPWACWFRRSYGWSGSRDLGDCCYLDTLVWKNIVPGLETFLSVSKVTIGAGASTSFWFGLWLGDTTLQDRFPSLLSHSTRIHMNVATALTFDFRNTLGPRLSQATEGNLRDLANELSLVAPRHLSWMFVMAASLATSSRRKVSAPTLSGICRLMKHRIRFGGVMPPSSTRFSTGWPGRSPYPQMDGG